MELLGILQNPAQMGPLWNIPGKLSRCPPSSDSPSTLCVCLTVVDIVKYLTVGLIRLAVP